MDNKDFLTVQNEVIEKVFELENIKRREYLAQFKYISLFHDYIIEQATLQYENRIMLEAIKSKADNVEFNVVEKKKELEDKIKGFEANNNLGKQVLEVYDKYSLEDINSLDELYNKLNEFVLFELWADKGIEKVIRFVTNFNTSEKELEEFFNKLDNIL